MATLFSPEFRAKLRAEIAANHPTMDSFDRYSLLCEALRSLAMTPQWKDRAAIGFPMNGGK